MRALKHANGFINFNFKLLSQDENRLTQPRNLGRKIILQVIV
jgi:hypothetical protein